MELFNSEQIEFIRNLRVLYFEDDHVTSKFASRCFSNYFDSIEVYNEPEAAFDKINFNEYDLVITDINMPNMMGHVLIKEIKKINNKMKFIVISAHTDRKYLIESGKLGVSGYIEKPMVIGEFEEVLFNLTNQRVDKKDSGDNSLIFDEDDFINL